LEEILPSLLLREEKRDTAKTPRKRKRPATTKWIEENARFIKKHGLRYEDLADRGTFGVDLGISDRCRDVLFLRLTQRQRSTGRDWREESLVLQPGQSVGWCPVGVNKFPCVTPQGHFLVSHKGFLFTATGLDTLAVQGVQKREVDMWQLQGESSRLLQDLAGNAMTVNILIAALLAVLPHVPMQTLVE
jgi:hypothetical protein